MLPVVVARSFLGGNAIRYVVCTSRFVDNIMFSHNGANGPKSKTTRLFRPVRRVAAGGVSDRIDCLNN